MITVIVAIRYFRHCWRKYALFLQPFLSPHGAWYVETYRLLFFCRPRLSVTLSTKSAKFGSRYLVDRFSEGDEIWYIGSPGLAVHQPRLVIFGPCRRPPSGVKKFVALFSYIVWPSAMKFGTTRGIGAYQILRDLVNFGVLFRGAKIFHGGYLTFCRSVRGRALANQHLFPEFLELWSGGSAIP